MEVIAYSVDTNTGILTQLQVALFEEKKFLTDFNPDPSNHSGHHSTADARGGHPSEPLWEIPVRL